MNRVHITMAAGVAALALLAGTAPAVAAPHTTDHWSENGRHVGVQILTPTSGSNAGTGGKGWMVDLVATYPTVAASGFTGPQLTGPAAHASTAPFPGTFSTGADEHLPGLVVLGSTTTSSVAGFSGPGTNLANLFNLTSLIDQKKNSATIQDTWIVGAPILGSNTDTTLTVAIVNDLNHDGVYNDAPATVPDANHDGQITASDLRALGVVGSVQTVRLHLAGE
jgi:hypothetical protein